MKTIINQIAPGIRTIVASLIIVVALTGISKGENSNTATCKINDDSLTLQVKSWVKNGVYLVDPNTRQIEEPATGGIESGLIEVTEADNRELSHQMESWMSNSSFWNDESENKEQGLVKEMKSWLNNRSCWSRESESKDADLALKMKSWISSCTFWSEETMHQEQELAGQIRTWINNSAFWHDSNDQLPFSDQLANN